MNRCINMFTIGLTLICQLSAFSQEDTLTIETTSSELSTDDGTTVEKIELFHGTRIINAHSVENLRKGVLEFRVEHRFGDLAGSNGGAQTWFGMDNSSDIRLAFEYGLTNNLMIGVGRSKGNGNPYRSLIDGFAKYYILHQSENMPFSLSGLGTMSYSYAKASSDIYSVSNYPKQIHRMAYSAQLIIARKFHDRLSLALLPTLVHRNYVKQDDVNTLFSLGGAARIGINSKMGVLIE
jgi:Membrane bound beta barrel domain (DUF5777)